MVVDSSAWVEFLRATGSPAHLRLRQALVAGEDIGVVDVVRLELLAGAGTDEEHGGLSAMLAGFPLLPCSSPVDHDLAAHLFRSAR